ncbi:MAG: glycosyltransferase family 2 protein [Raoultibacter sp.]
MKVLIIIPAYNEEDSIESTVKTVVDAGYDYVIINDGSTDKTRSLCEANNFNVINLPQNLGIGGAVQTGHKYAFENNYDVDIQFDGDGQHDVSYIEPLITAIENGSDLVVGSRFLEQTEGFQSSWLRRVGITWLSFFIKLFTGKKVHDPTSGFRATGKHALEVFCRNYPIDYPEPESIVVALKLGLKVDEVSVLMHERQGGTSSIGGISSVYYMIKVSLSIAILSFSTKKNPR